MVLPNHPLTSLPAEDKQTVVDALQIYISSALTIREMILPRSFFHNP